MTRDGEVTAHHAKMLLRPASDRAVAHTHLLVALMLVVFALRQRHCIKGVPAIRVPA
ncbi:MAG: hypothetical protein ABSG07_13340 [Terriglobales bacterium]|jgi:hypothetical protein